MNSMLMANSSGPKFYGTVLVGERGQVVIPKEARQALKIKAGDKLIVLGGPGGGGKLVLAKAEALREFAEKLLSSLR